METVKIKEYSYTIVDEPLKVGDWYINMFAVDHARSVQRIPDIKSLKNLKKDYRFSFCKKVIATNNPTIKL